MSENVINVGGLTPMTSIDYPGELAAVIFCQGCPWRCRYCHNYDLLNSGRESALNWDDVLAFLETRHGLLDAVVFSGGEPTRQKRLGEAMQQVRDMGFKVGLHTSGAYPDRLREVLPHCDWVGMDIKAPFGDYVSVTETPKSGERAWQSARHIVDSGVPHQFRTTVHPELLGHDDIRMIHEQLLMLGSERLHLQDCIATNCLDPALRDIPPPSPV